ncbi:hypothetical protein D9K79_11655 [Acinetobacter cumulans]|uniref:Uncharacterized protein n=1 Tax=Acinetobacter cumulans TaxID=2136182 RepID=A0ABX9U601_9GAMM|nr:hypothetical protein [Acinetobacter cumulans]RLL43016.1 hypothetical protein D9K79_11655 [Acinetobacter cumulans]
MNKSNLFKAAHNLTKKVIKAGDNYRVTFGAAIKAIKEGFVATTKSFTIYFSNAWTGVDYTEVISANSHKEAVEKFEAEKRIRARFVAETPAQEIKEVKEVEDAETILFEMDCKGVDSMKFKAHNRTRAITVTRKQCVDYLDYLNQLRQVKKITRTQAMA